MVTPKVAPEDRKKLGRPRLVTDEMRANILRTVALGFPPARAAQAQGISRQTLHEHGKANPDFLDAMKAAEAQAEFNVYGRILKASATQWTAAAWILERRWPESYAKFDPKMIVNNNNEANAVAVQAGPVAPLGLEQLASELKRTAEITGEVLKIAVEFPTEKTSGPKDPDTSGA
jgi:hypothetical protein